MPRAFVLSSTMILLFAGCGCREESPPSGRQNLSEAPKIAPLQTPPGDPGEQTENGPGENVKEPARIEIDPMNLDEESGVQTHNTGDLDVWTSFEDWPVVIEIEVPEVPEGLSELAPPIP